MILAAQRTNVSAQFLRSTLLVVVFAASAGGVRAGLLDRFCTPGTRLVDWTSEDALGTTWVGLSINTHKEPNSHHPSSTVELRVNTRRCPFSTEIEYETWVSRKRRESGGSEWVPLMGSIHNFKDPQYWLVGSKLPPNTDFLAYVAANKPERRVVRLRFPEDVERRVEAGTIGGIRLVQHTSKWVHIPKGSPVKLPDGRTVPVTQDLAGIEISLTLKRQGAPDDYPDDFYLAAENLDLLTDRLACDRCRGFSPGESRVVALSTTTKGLDEHRTVPPKYLVNIRNGLRIALPPLDR